MNLFVEFFHSPCDPSFIVANGRRKGLSMRETKFCYLCGNIFLVLLKIFVTLSRTLWLGSVFIQYFERGSITMDLRKEVDKLLGKLGNSLGLADLALDENNHCILLFDDKVILNLELDEEKEILVVYSYIGEVPFEGRENIFESFLESNFFWKNTQGATLGIDKHTQTVVLAYPMELPLKNKDIFEERLAVFVDVTEQWIDRLERMSQEAETLANEER